jgi:hypothetical protein
MVEQFFNHIPLFSSVLLSHRSPHAPLIFSPLSLPDVVLHSSSSSPPFHLLYYEKRTNSRLMSPSCTWSSQGSWKNSPKVSSSRSSMRGRAILLRKFEISFQFLLNQKRSRFLSSSENDNGACYLCSKKPLLL